MKTSTDRKALLAKQAIETICDLSGLDEEEVSHQASFLELGFDSLFMTQLASALQKVFTIEITFRQLIRELDTLDKLVIFLDTHLPSDAFAPEPIAEELPAPSTTEIEASSPNVSQAFIDQSAILRSGTPIESSLQAIMNEQLQLMSMQLALLQGQSVSPSASAPPPIEKPTSATEHSREPAKSASTPAKEKVESNEVIKLPPGFGPQVEGAKEKKSLGEKQKHLDELTAAYNARTAKSKSMTQKYRMEHADPRTAAGFNIFWKEIVYPIVVERSKGSRLWDIDGNEYIDLLNGFGPNFLGHAPDFVQEALHKQVDKGFEIGPQTPLAGEVAHMICEMTGLDRATFVNTGSEAVQAVMRVARTITGRDKIVVFNKDYHGNFDEVLVRGANAKNKPRTLPMAPGIPRASVNNILVLDYGHEYSLEVIAEHAHEIAGVLIEPVQSRFPDVRPVEFIRKLRKLTEEKDIAFIFDEVITGFRTGLGGAQEYYGVKADMATYGKVLGGGMPIGVVAGKKRFMDTFDGGTWQYGDDSFPEAGVTFFAGTFLRHPLTIAATHATLTYLKEQGPEIYCKVYEKTTRLATTLNRLFENNGIDIFVAHFSSQMYFRISDDNELIQLLFYHARLRGLYMLEGFPSYMTLAHSEEDVDRVIEIFTESVAALQAGGIIALPRNREVKKFPLSPAQREIWTASQLSKTASCAYNESDTVSLNGHLDVNKLKLAQHMVWQRHVALNITIDEDGLEQHVDWTRESDLQELDLAAYTEEGAGEKLEAFFETQATTPFDLEKGPLVRMHLVRLKEDQHLLVVYGHHIAFDGWSSSILLHEIGSVYSALMEGRQLRLPTSLGYHQYIAEEAEWLNSEQAQRDLSYWKNCFPQKVPVNNLPVESERGTNRSFEGDTLHYEYEDSLLNSVKKASAECGVTVHSFLLAGFLILLHLKSKDESMVIGIPTAGQMLASNDCLVGYCVNLLPMHQKIDGEKSCKDFLCAVSDNVLDTFEHQHCSFSQLLESLPVTRAPGRAPLVEIVFNYSSYFKVLEFSGLTTGVYENRRRAVIFDLFLNIVEMGDSLHVDWDYNSNLFSEEMITQWVEELGKIYQVLSQSLNTSLTDLELKLDQNRTKTSAECKV